MAVPELALFGIECFEEGGADHVFDADKAGVGVRGVVDETLADIWDRQFRRRGFSDGDISMVTFVQMRAVVVRFDAARGLGGIGMECV